MGVNRELETLLKSCSECVRTSYSLRKEFSDSIRSTRDAVDASRALIAQSDAAIERLRALTATSPQSSQGPPPERILEVVSGCSFENQRVLLDGKHFVNCTLNNCTLEYSGQAVVLETTAFTSCNFDFRAEAAMTMQLMECFELVARSRKSGYSEDPDEHLRPQQRN
jgi:hypothetical protein